MSRLARVVIPGLPHHVTQRGNGRAQTFFEDGDYALYRDLLAETARRARTEVWAWCLMPNHVHLILVPADEDGLRRTLSPLHRQYTGYINARRRQTGHLWQGRFGSVVMDGDHALTAIHYVAMNPVRAGLAQAPEEWPWSSARAYLSGDDDGVTSVETVREMVGDFKSFFGRPFETDQAYGALRQAETIGRPLGSAAWLKDLEARTGRKLAPGKRGRKPKQPPLDG